MGVSQVRLCQTDSTFSIENMYSFLEAKKLQWSAGFTNLDFSKAFDGGIQETTATTGVTDTG